MTRSEKREASYKKRMEYFAEHPKVALQIHMINQVVTWIHFGAYPLLLIWLLLNHDSNLAKAIIIPLDSFIILSVFRYLINRKRPYEKYGVGPAIAKDTKGKSFPSRHVFCAFVIAMTFVFVFPHLWCGICLFIMGLVLAVLRVTAGVHYISDVIAGAICGIVAGLFYLI